MTFFLSDHPPAPTGRQGPNVAPSTFLGGLGAGFKKGALENDANFRAARETVKERDDVARLAARTLGPDRVRKLLEEKNRKATELGMPSQVVDIPKDPDEMARLLGSNGSKQIIDLARQDAAANPTGWRGVDLSDDGMTKRVNERLRAEHQAYSAELEMMPGGRAIAELLGGMGGMTADIKNLPFLFGGAGGSFLRVAGREALLNMGAEAAFLPSQFDMAERLDIPDPNVVQQLATAAVAGAALGVAFEAAGRGASYVMGRRRLPPSPRPAEHAAAVEAAEDAMIAGDDPAKAAREILGIEATPPLKMLTDMREPLIRPDEEGLFLMPDATRPPESNIPPDGVPAVETTTLPPQPSFAELIAQSKQRLADRAVMTDTLAAQPGGVKLTDKAGKQALVTPASDGGTGWRVTYMDEQGPSGHTDHADKASAVRDALEQGYNPPEQNIGDIAAQAIKDAEVKDSRMSRPLSAWIKGSGFGSSDVRIDPAGPLGQELKARGVTSKTYPGLFKKGGRGELDDLVASEMEETFPGIIDATGSSWEPGAYLDRDGLLEVLVRDAQGDGSWLPSRNNANRVREEAFDAEAETTAIQDYAKMEPAPDGFFVDPATLGFDPEADARIGENFDAHLERNNLRLSPDERDEIVQELSTRGGDADYLIERAFMRDADELDAAARGQDDDPFGESFPTAESPAGAGARADGQSQPSPGNEAQSGASGAESGGVRGEAEARGTATELTPAGQQSLIPGVAPISVRERLEQAQAKPLSAGAREADSQIGGLFDPDDKVRRDLFDDPTSDAARPIQDAIQQDFRDQLDMEPDLEVDFGNGPRSMSSVLDELDGDEEFMAVLDICGKSGGRE